MHTELVKKMTWQLASIFGGAPGISGFILSGFIHFERVISKTLSNNTWTSELFFKNFLSSLARALWQVNVFDNSSRQRFSDSEIITIEAQTLIMRGKLIENKRTKISDTKTTLKGTPAVLFLNEYPKVQLETLPFTSDWLEFVRKFSYVGIPFHQSLYCSWLHWFVRSVVHLWNIQ